MITKDEYEKAKQLIRNYEAQEREKIRIKELTIDMDKGKCMEECCNNFAAVDYNGHGYWVCRSCDDRLERHFEDEYN